MKSAIGYVCLAIAIYFACKAIGKRKVIKDCHGKKINTTIVGNDAQLVGGMCVYYPIYSYEIDGEMREYRGKCPSAIMMKIGEQIPMYYNSATRTPVEIVSIASDLTLAMVFGGISVLFLSMK